MILVTFAVPFESAEFRRRAVSRTVRIVHTGVGAVAARTAVERAVCEELPEQVISSGFAGALALGLPIGAIVTDSRLATSDQVLATAAAKREFHARAGKDAVDMESGAIREVCAVANVPFKAIRAISDGAEDDLGLEPGLLAGMAAMAPTALARAAWILAWNGARRRAFLNLVRNSRVAQVALADALERELGRGISET